MLEGAISDMNIYYVYAYLRKDGTPYYIGKGKNKRYIEKHNVEVPKDRKFIVFLETHLTDIGALALERRYIKWYGRKDLGTGILRNKTDGGEGPSGQIAHNKGQRIPKEICESVKIKKEKIRPGTGAHVGKKFSDETKAKMSAARKGKPLSAETRAKMSEARKRLFAAVKANHLLR